FLSLFSYEWSRTQAFLTTEANSGKNFLYFSRMDGFRQNNDILCPYFFSLEFSGSCFLQFFWRNAC
ncbi:hypothetical protein, partial [Paenibacillus macerans]